MAGLRESLFHSVVSNTKRQKGNEEFSLAQVLTDLTVSGAGWMPMSPKTPEEFRALAGKSFMFDDAPFRMGAGERMLHFNAKEVKEPPPPLLRVNHSAFCYEGSLYIFGGRTAASAANVGNYCNAIHVFIVPRSSWVELPAKGTPPTKRGDMATVIYHDNLIVHGGRKHLLFLDDMFTFCFSTGRWTPITYEKTSGPGAVFGHTMNVWRDKLYIVGGVHKDTQDFFIHIFDMKYNYWSGLHGPIGVHANSIQKCTAAVSPPTQELIVFGLQSSSQVLTEALGSQPVMFSMGLDSGVWQPINLTPSPESPIPMTSVGLIKKLLPTLMNVEYGAGTFCHRRALWLFPGIISGGESESSTSAPSVKKRDSIFSIDSLGSQRQMKTSQRLSMSGASHRSERDRDPVESFLLGPHAHPPSLVAAHSSISKHTKKSSAPVIFGIFVFNAIEKNWSLCSVSFPESASPPKLSLDVMSPYERKLCACIYRPAQPQGHHQATLGDSKRESLILFGSSSLTDRIFLRFSSGPPSRKEKDKALFNALSPGVPPKTPNTNIWKKSPFAEPVQPPAADTRSHASSDDLLGSGRSSLEGSGRNDEALYFPFAPEYGIPYSAMEKTGCPVATIATNAKLSDWRARYYKLQCNWIQQEKKKMDKMASDTKKKKNKERNSPETARGIPGGSNSTAKKKAGQQKPTATPRAETARPKTLSAAEEKQNAIAATKMCTLLFDSAQLQFNSGDFVANPRLLAQLRWGLVRQYVLSGQATAAHAAQSKLKQLRPSFPESPSRGAQQQQQQQQHTVFGPVMKVMAQSNPVTAGSTDKLKFLPALTVEREVNAEKVMKAPKTAASGGGPSKVTVRKWGNLMAAMQSAVTRRHQLVPVHAVPYDLTHPTPKPPK